MKTKIVPLMMALLLIPAFSQGMLGNNASAENGQELTSGNMTLSVMSQIKNQVQNALQSRNHTTFMVQNMSIEILNGSVNINAHKNNEQKIVMNANMLRLNNEELFNGSSAIMAEINLAIRNQGEDKNLSIQSKNGEVIISENQTIVRIRNMEMIMENNSLFLNISNQAVELNITPLQAMNVARIQNQTRTSSELIVEGETPKYQIREQKNVKVLGLFEARMDVDSKINALNGILESQSKPWWSFLAAESE
jgi:hypothetical protein